MTRDEFVGKYKVGDTIEYGLGSSVKILFIGGQKFYGLSIEYSLEHAYPFEEDWRKVQTPKLPSEEIIKYGRIYSAPGNTTMNLQSSAEYANDRIDDILKWLDKNWPNVQMKGEK